MNEQMRLDKFLCEKGFGTRTEVKKIIGKGLVTVNGDVVKRPELKINTEQDEVAYLGETLKYQKYEYYMLNKPVGVVSATQDNLHQTVIELITESDKKDLFPVGRLDVDTEGLLLISNDGELAHRLLSPKKHVPKTYYAEIDGKVTAKEVSLFKQGIQLEEDFMTLPAELKILHSDRESEVEVTIYEGKFHQVKRMFQAVGMEVLYLKRIAMGPLTLDPTLMTGEYRTLTEAELSSLMNR